MFNLIYLNLFIFFSYLFSNISSDEIQITGIPEQYSDVYRTSKNFKIVYTYNKANYNELEFLSIKIENSAYYYNIHLGHIAFLSLYDEQCKEERKQMSMNSGGDSLFIIKKSELQSLSYFHLCVKCLNESKCYYLIRFDQNYIQRFPMTDISYTYYVSKDYTEMKFGIRAEDTIKDKIVNNNAYELFWFKKLFNNNEFIPYNNSVPKDYNGIYLTNTISEDQRYLDFNISSYEGDEIKVGSSLIINGIVDKPLNVNDIETIGHLKKGKLEKECFDFVLSQYYSNGKQFYLQGYIYDKFAKTYFIDKRSYNIIYDTQKEIINGIIFEMMNKNEVYNRRFCVEFLKLDKYEELDNITFSIQLISHEFNTYNYLFNSPQVPEIVFPGYLNGGDYMILSNIKSPKKSSTMSITLNSIYGYPKILYHRCIDFPFYNVSLININYYEEIRTNTLMECSFFSKVINSFYYYQPLFIIYCPDDTEVCIFDTTFFNEKDYVILSEGKIFSQFLLDQYKENKYLVDFDKYKGISKVIIELLAFNSNAKLTIENNNLNIINYFLINKYVYIINVNENNFSEKKIKFKIKSDKNGYYSVRYNLISDDEDLNKIKLIDTIGINYIDYINTTYKYKIIEVQNSKYNFNFPIIINFYTLDCKFRIKKNGTVLENYLYNNFYQEYIDDNNKYSYIYNLSLIESEYLNYQNKKCILYSNNINVTIENNAKIGTLLMSEKTPHIFKFDFKNNLKTIRYIYHNIDNKNDILVNLKLFNKAKYMINIGSYTHRYFDNIIENEFFYDSKIFSLEKEIIICRETECNLLIEITLLETLTSETPMIETTLQQIKDKFIYLEKGIIKEKYIKKNNNLYFYTEIGFEDEGYIMYDYLKGKNEIAGKIIKKEQIEINEEVIWINIKNGKDISNYDFTTKKLVFTKEDTSDCQNGCYLLLNIKSPDINVKNKFFSFKIMVNLINLNNLNLPKIRFEPDEYVVGTLLNKKDNDGKMFEFYEINIPYNARSIDIECLSETAKLLIYIGNEIKDDYDFEINPGKTINILNEDINTKLKISSIENVNIIICVYAEKLDLFDISYSFKVHLNKDNDTLKIYKINNSQKTLCQPIKIDEEYRCLFMITPSVLNCLDYLILYAKSQSKYAKTIIYGDYLINNTIYDLYDDRQLEYYIPNINSTYKSEKNNQNFIFLYPKENSNYFYISVISNDSSSIELISNFYNYNDGFIPKPNLMNIFVLNKDLKNEIKLNFNSENSIMINVQSLYGKGEINYNEKKYNLKDINDRISFSFKSDIDEYLIIKNKNIHNNENSLSEDLTQESEFIFYVEYYLRNSTINFDKINFGQTSEINYKNGDFPLFFYSQFDKNMNYDINIFFDFQYLALNNTSNLTKIIKNKELNIMSFFSDIKNKYEIINNIQNKKNLKVKCNGVYDPAINIGQIYIPKEITNNQIISEFDNLTYYFTIEKNIENIENEIIYKGINLETIYIKENSGIPIVENKYHFGKIYNNNINSYKLKIDKTDLSNYTIIYFSSNSKIVNFTITTEGGKKQETNNIFDEYESKEEGGKIITIFKKPNDIDFIYLNVFINNNNTLNISQNYINNLNNYAFKYNNIMNKENIFKYSVTNNNYKLQGIVSNKNIEIEYNKISNQKDYIVIYSLKYVRKEDLIEGELYNSIALSESNSTIFQTTNYKTDNKNVINIPFDDDDNFAYIGLIAQIINGDDVEYISYEPINSKNELIFKSEKSNPSNESKTSVGFIILIIVAIIIIIIIGVILFMRFKNKKGETHDILKQVEMSKPIEYEDILLDQ